MNHFTVFLSLHDNEFTYWWSDGKYVCQIGFFFLFLCPFVHIFILWFNFSHKPIFLCNCAWMDLLSSIGLVQPMLSKKQSRIINVPDASLPKDLRPKRPKQTQLPIRPRKLEAQSQSPRKWGWLRWKTPTKSCLHRCRPGLWPVQVAIVCGETASRTHVSAAARWSYPRRESTVQVRRRSSWARLERARCIPRLPATTRRARARSWGCWCKATENELNEQTYVEVNKGTRGFQITISPII